MTYPVDILICIFISVNITAFPGDAVLAHDGAQAGLVVAQLVRHARLQGTGGTDLDAGHAVPAFAGGPAAGLARLGVQHHEVAGADHLAGGLGLAAAAVALVQIYSRGHGWLLAYAV